MKCNERKHACGWLVAVLLVVLLAGAATTFAYFTWIRSADPALSLDTTAQVIEVGSFRELFQASQAEAYLDGADVSQSTSPSRRTLKLTQSIRMPADLVITADVHLDLGGYDLLTDGHTLTFRHTYHGAVIMSGGRVILDGSGKGGVLADTPNAAVFFDGITVGTLSADGAFSEAAAGEHLQILSADPSYIAYHFFRSVAAAMADESNLLLPADAYAEIAGRTAFAPELFLGSTGTECSAHPAQPCSYVLADLDLPVRYLGYPGVSVTYTTENGVLLPDGRLVGTGAETLTATVTVTSGSAETVYRCSFLLDAPDLSTEDARAAVAESLAARYLWRFWVESTTDGETVTEVKSYVLNRDIQLPTVFSTLPGVVLQYSGYAEDGSQTFPRADEEPERTAATVLFIPTTDTVKLTLRVLRSSDEGTLRSREFSVSSTNTFTVRSAVTLANDLLKKWYGTEITVTANGDGSYSYSGADDGSSFAGSLPLYGMEYYRTHADGAYAVAYPGVKRIAYSVVYGNTKEQYYAITEGTDGNSRFAVVTGKPEEDAGRTFLNVQLLVEYNGEDSEVTLQIPVECALGTGGGGNRFLPYYSVFNRLSTDATGEYTLSAFSMPFNYQRDLPLVCYGFAAQSGTAEDLQKVVSALGMVFVDHTGKETVLVGKTVTRTITESDGTEWELTFLSFSDALDALLPGGSDLRSEAESGTAYFRITIDKDQVPVTNTGVRLVYQYRMSYAAEEWSLYHLFSDFTVPGILHYGSDILDENFFLWLYNSFRISGDAIDAVGDHVIYTDWLGQNVPLDFANSTDPYLRATVDFTGIRYMTGTQQVNLSGAVVSAGVLREIAQMRSLLSLDLSDCGIVLAAGADNPFAAWCDASTSALTNLRELHLESNRINSFLWLSELCSAVAVNLENIYLSGNIPGTGDADNVFYGSDGLSNYGVYQELLNIGIQVWSGGTKEAPVLFADSRSASQIYLNLHRLVYQNKLPASASLAEILSQFSTDPLDYGLTSTASNRSYSCSVSGVGVRFDVVDETSFTLTCSAASGGIVYSIVLNFSVVRI